MTATLHCPKDMVSHVQKVLTGEYVIPFQKENVVILDIGANVGAFAIFALQKWPTATIHCYEPNPTTFQYLQHNLKTIFPTRNATPYNVAIGNPKNTKLYLGKHNCGECSLYHQDEQIEDHVIVKTIPPKELPPADILKIDTEGSELDILKGVNLNYSIITLEYHSEKDRRKIDKVLKDYSAISGFIRTLGKGVITYARNNIL